jgi:hypothetical protein
MWCIPPKQNAAFVAQMEQVLEVYQRPFNPRRPVVCMDEQPKQLVREEKSPLPGRAGAVERYDYLYVREGVCNVWMFVEPLAGWREVPVSANKTAQDWARHVQWLVDHPRYAEADLITLVLDNLNIHGLSSLYATFEPAEALRIAQRLEIIHTPVHGSWLNIAEIELSALTRQCLDRRIPTLHEVASQAAAWHQDRNNAAKTIHWQFTTPDARVKLHRLYPHIVP